MQISLVNFTKNEDADVQNVVRAINRQIEGDYAPYWNMGAVLRLEGRVGTKVDKQSPQELRGDAIIYLWDKSADVDGALGYHDANNRGLPYGFVFTQISKDLGEHWSVTLSHEALELIGDTNVNLLAAGPSPHDANKLVYHWYEMCDAVQAEAYEVDGVEVSNFVLPSYFTIGEQVGSRNDFLGTVAKGKRLHSFGINPGGYIGFFNPETGKDETFSMKGDQKAKARLDTKRKLKGARRSNVYLRAGTRVTGKAAFDDDLSGGTRKKKTRR